MKTSTKLRAAAAIASVLMTLATVWSIADYALPGLSPVQLAMVATR